MSSDTLCYFLRKRYVLTIKLFCVDFLCVYINWNPKLWYHADYLHDRKATESPLGTSKKLFKLLIFSRVLQYFKNQMNLRIIDPTAEKKNG